MYQDELLENMKEIIKSKYKDNRKITGYATGQIQGIAKKHEIYGDVFETQENELISLDIIDEDFDKKQLEKYKKYGEELYEKSQKLVSIYILCVKQATNKLNSDEIKFNGKLLFKIDKMDYSYNYKIFRIMSEFVKNKVKFGRDDLIVLSMIPKMGPSEDLRYMRIECLKLWKEINRKGLIK